MIIIDQAKIDAPDFPRDQAWWDRFAPVWIAATVLDGGIVRLMPSGLTHDYSMPGNPVVQRELSAAQIKRQRDAIARWVAGLPRIACAAVPRIPT